MHTYICVCCAYSWIARYLRNAVTIPSTHSASGMPFSAATSHHQVQSWKCSISLLLASPVEYDEGFPRRKFGSEAMFKMVWLCCPFVLSIWTIQHILYGAFESVRISSYPDIWPVYGRVLFGVAWSLERLNLSASIGLRWKYAQNVSFGRLQVLTCLNK